MKRTSERTKRILVDLLILVLFVIAFLLFMNKQAQGQESFSYRTAAQCKGEADFAIPECACTVWSRLQSGWTEDTVFVPYYAEPVTPTEFEVWMAGEVLSRGCAQQPLYFMFSKADIDKLGITFIPALVVVHDVYSNHEVWFYEYNYADRREQ